MADPYRRDVLRFPAAVTPLTAALLAGPLTAGAVRAAEELDLPRSGPRHRVEGPWVLTAEPERAGGRPLADDEAAAAAAVRRWGAEHLPAVEAAIVGVEALTFADPAADLPALLDACEELWRRRWLGLHAAAAAVTAFVRRHVAATGDGALAAHGCLRGESSRTLAADQALWEVCQAALGSPGLMLALQAPTPDYALAVLEASEDGLAWRDALLRTLAVHGRRALLIELATPSWAEDAGFAVGVARRYGARPAREPEVCLRAGRAGREAAVAAARERLGDAEGRAYDRALAVARAAQPLLLDVAFHVDGGGIAAAVRPAALRLGAALVAAGRLDRADDVLFLDLEGLRATAGGADGRAAALAGLERMAEGAAGDPAAASPGAGRGGAVAGTAAAPGRATGTARAIASLHDLGALRPAEVLVCRTATAAFSPLLPSLAGLACEAGDALAPGAVAAREYGVPAVTGAEGALSRIPDDAPVTIDGDAGTLTVA